MPLLVIWLGYAEREATGTSLAAIVPIAGLAAALQAAYGNVDPLKGLLIGAPAIVGVVAGVALAQRIPERAVAAAFAVLLLASALALVF